ncbi:MAG: hypothetical protein D6732_16750 [Methanobacteriota archaeon]|nr:MAG: hypothetical protein D6732_16750 [Euryarchaeota archaeon]
MVTLLIGSGISIRMLMRETWNLSLRTQTLPWEFLGDVQCGQLLLQDLWILENSPVESSLVSTTFLWGLEKSILALFLEIKLQYS